jgi:hypothetical protein
VNLAEKQDSEPLWYRVRRFEAERRSRDCEAALARVRCHRKTDQGKARSLGGGPELDLLNVLKRDEAWYPILRVDDHKGRDVRIHFLRNRRQVNEVGMIDGKTAARAGNDNKGRKRIGFDDVRNLFSRHKADIRQEFANSKQIILLLGKLNSDMN